MAYIHCTIFLGVITGVTSYCSMHCGHCLTKVNSRFTVNKDMDDLFWKLNSTVFTLL